MIKMVLIDDQNLIREALRHLLESEDNFQVVAETSFQMEWDQIIEDEKIDLIILHFERYHRNCMQVLLKLKKTYPFIKLLVLFDKKDFFYVQQVLSVGIEGCILTESSFSELKNAINLVYQGKIYVSSEMCVFDDDKKNIIQEDEQKIQSLTKRETEILKNVALGMYNKEIALKFEISERTVKNHISNIFKKICVSDRTQAAVFAIRNQMINIYR